MPPKRGTKGAKTAAAAAAATASPLQDCKIALSGSFPGLPQATIKGQISQLGGTFSGSVTAATTHLLATQADFDKPSTKTKDAKDQGIHVLSLQWLQDCLSSNSRVPEQPHLLGISPPTNGSQVVQPEPSAKRPASPFAPDTSSDTVSANKRAKTNGASAGTDQSNSATSTDARIPLDEGCPLLGYAVYVDDVGTIWDASLNQTHASHNNNKFYRIQLLHNGAGDHKTWTRWGRVGDRGQTAILGNGTRGDAMKKFNGKFRDKSGLTWENREDNPVPGKYAFIERSYNAESDEEEAIGDAESATGPQDENWVPPVCTLAAPIQKLMELIFNQQYFAATMSDLNYDANKLPLGKLSKAAITRGFQALKDLSALLDDHTLAQSIYNKPLPAAIETLSNLYYTLIPHAFGRNRPPVIQEYGLLKKEIVLLESLGDMKDAELIMKVDRVRSETVHQLDKQYLGLGMEEMRPLDPLSTEFSELRDYLMKTRGATHSADYAVEDIFRIERQGEHDRFHKSAFSGTPRDRRLLWHGSRATNFGGILSQGLRIAPPEAPVSGYMFGKGIYLADMSSKSANYCCSYISGGTALLLLCEAELGNPLQQLVHSSYSAGEDAKAKGLLSTWGQGQTGPNAWKDAACVHPNLSGVKMPDVKSIPGPTKVPNAVLLYNEYIVYDVAQVRLRYLFRVKM